MTLPLAEKGVRDKVSYQGTTLVAPMTSTK
jgi:hypothetical protein